MFTIQMRISNPFIGWKFGILFSDTTSLLFLYTILISDTRSMYHTQGPLSANEPSKIKISSIVHLWSRVSTCFFSYLRNVTHLLAYYDGYIWTTYHIDGCNYSSYLSSQDVCYCKLLKPLWEAIFQQKQTRNRECCLSEFRWLVITAQEKDDHSKLMPK
jgi:hypothetical protein